MHYAASGTTNKKLRSESDVDTVFISGRVIDSVEIVEPVLSALNPSKRPDYTDKVRSWFRNCEAIAKLCRSYPGEDTSEEAYWLTLTANLSRSVFDPQPALGDCFQYLEDYIDRHADADGNVKAWNEARVQKGHIFWVMFLRACFGRSFFASKRRFIGFAPLIEI